VAAHAILSLFTQPDSSGADLEFLSAWILRAADDGAAPTDTARQAAALIARLVARDGDGLPSVIAEWAGAVPIEARIADASAANHLETLTAAFRGDLRAVLSQLRADPNLTAYLQDKGELTAFQSAADRVLGRLLAGQLQNLHGLDQPYVFFEVPFAAGAPVREARVHLFHESRAGHRKHEPHAASVTLDLSTTELGDLWITLQFAEGNCACRVAATSPAAIAAIESARDELLRGLEAAGYAHATVHLDLWDGDRLRETGRLMGRFSGIDLKA
jgi:hypothetical protein